MGSVEELWNMKTMLRKIVIRKNVEKVHLDDNVDERCAAFVSVFGIGWLVFSTFVAQSILLSLLDT